MFQDFDNSLSKELDKDSLGSGFSLVDTGIYVGKILNAYITKSDAGAIAVNLEFDLNNGQKYRETIYVTNRNGQNFYERDGKKHGLPGFLLIESLALCTTNKGLAEQPQDMKLVPIYDRDAQKEVPVEVPVLVELLGEEVAIAIQRIIENKQEKNESTGKWEAINEERELNQINRVFHYPTMLTVGEAREGLSEGAFHIKWEEKFGNETINKFKEVSGGRSSGRSASKPQGGSRPSLFDNK